MWVGGYLCGEIRGCERGILPREASNSCPLRVRRGQCIDATPSYYFPSDEGIQSLHIGERRPCDDLRQRDDTRRPGRDLPPSGTLSASTIQLHFCALYIGVFYRPLINIKQHQPPEAVDPFRAAASLGRQPEAFWPLVRTPPLLFCSWTIAQHALPVSSRRKGFGRAQQTVSGASAELRSA